MPARLRNIIVTVELSLCGGFFIFPYLMPILLGGYIRVLPCSRIFSSFGALQGKPLFLPIFSPPPDMPIFSYYNKTSHGFFALPWETLLRWTVFPVSVPLDLLQQADAVRRHGLPLRAHPNALLRRSLDTDLLRGNAQYFL